MLNTALRCSGFNRKSLFYTNNLTIKFNRIFLQKPCVCSCRCIYSKGKNRFVENARFNSSSSHGPNSAIETMQPKIVINKQNCDDAGTSKDGSYNVRLKVFWRDKVDPYVKLARWDRPIGVYLLYWPCAWSIALASLPAAVPFQVTVETALLFLVGAGLMRGAGCTINDMWDRDIDSQVERTKQRPLVSGAVTQRQAVAFLAVQLSLALGVLLQLNCFSVALGASSMLLVVTYPLAKRFTDYPQIFLGATFNWGALLGYSAVQGAIDLAVCLPLYLGALTWTVIYDTIYAHQDKMDDLRIGMKSTAITFGANTKRALFIALGVSTVSFACAGLAANLDAGFTVALAAAAALAGRQIYNLDVDNPQDCGDKFKSNSTFGALILLGILLGGYDQYIQKGQTDENTPEWEAAKSCVFNSFN